MAGSIAQQRDDGRIQLALFGQTIVQLAKFDASRQFSEPQQVASLFEVRLVRQFVDIDAAIRQDAPISVDVTNLRSGCNDALHSFWRMICSHARHWFLASIAELLLLDRASRTREGNLFLYLKRTKLSNCHGRRQIDGNSLHRAIYGHFG